MASLTITMCDLPLVIFFFFFNDTATTEIYTLSLHDALPISLGGTEVAKWKSSKDGMEIDGIVTKPVDFEPSRKRSEEHTSELQSRLHLVCRLLLEKKKKTN